MLHLVHIVDVFILKERKKNVLSSRRDWFTQYSSRQCPPSLGKQSCPIIRELALVRSSRILELSAQTVSIQYDIPVSRVCMQHQFTYFELILLIFFSNGKHDL